MCKYCDPQHSAYKCAEKAVPVKISLIKEQRDIIALQETEISQDEHIEASLQKYLHRYEVCVTQAKGISVAWFLSMKKCFPVANISAESDDEGTLMICDFALYNEDWLVVRVYAPNKSSERCVSLEMLNSTSIVIKS